MGINLYYFDHFFNLRELLLYFSVALVLCIS
jgi:hypothetical protein